MRAGKIRKGFSRRLLFEHEFLCVPANFSASLGRVIFEKYQLQNRGQIT
jgi:hypothetical protein